MLWTHFFTSNFLFQALNLILLTSSELANLRDLLKKSLFDDAAKNLFLSLYASWCHSPMAIISLCLLAQVRILCLAVRCVTVLSLTDITSALFSNIALGLWSLGGVIIQTYQHASSVIQSLVEEDINVKFLVQLDKLIHLLETPTFVYLRLQVILIGCFLSRWINANLIHALVFSYKWIPTCAVTSIKIAIWV